MSDQQHEDRKRNLEIAKNEASREFVSDVRLTTWAVAALILVALVVLAVFLK